MYVDQSPGEGQRLGMTVSPDQLLLLKTGIEVERDRLRTWLEENSRQLATTQPPGADPCSEDTVTVFADNGSTAIEMARAYVDQLTTTATELHNSAREYGLVEDDNTGSFQREIE